MPNVDAYVPRLGIGRARTNLPSRYQRTVIDISTVNQVKLREAAKRRKKNHYTHRPPRSRCYQGSKRLSKSRDFFSWRMTGRARCLLSPGKSGTPISTYRKCDYISASYISRHPHEGGRLEDIFVRKGIISLLLWWCTLITDERNVLILIIIITIYVDNELIN